MYPNLYTIALDVLPFQSFAVSVERIFSASPETHALFEGTMSFQTFEALQRLKFTSSLRNVDIRDTAWGHLDTSDALKGHPIKDIDLTSLCHLLRLRELKVDTQNC